MVRFDSVRKQRIVGFGSAQISGLVRWKDEGGAAEAFGADGVAIFTVADVEALGGVNLEALDDVF